MMSLSSTTICFNLRIESLVIESVVPAIAVTTPYAGFQSQNWESCYWEIRSDIVSPKFVSLRFNLRIESLVIERRRAPGSAIPSREFQSQNWESCYWEAARPAVTRSWSDHVSISELRVLLLRGVYRQSDWVRGRAWFQSQNWESCYWEILLRSTHILRMLPFQSQNWESCYWELDNLRDVRWNERVSISELRVLLLRGRRSAIWTTRLSRVSISELRVLLLREDKIIDFDRRIRMFQSQNWESCYWEKSSKTQISSSTGHNVSISELRVLLLREIQTGICRLITACFNLRIESLVIESAYIIIRFNGCCLGFNLRIESLVIERRLFG